MNWGFGNGTIDAGAVDYELPWEPNEAWSTSAEWVNEDGDTHSAKWNLVWHED